MLVLLSVIQLENDHCSILHMNSEYLPSDRLSSQVKCEQYWDPGTRRFENITVTMTSEIPLEDWTIRDFDIKNVSSKTCFMHRGKTVLITVFQEKLLPGSAHSTHLVWSSCLTAILAQLQLHPTL